MTSERAKQRAAEIAEWMNTAPENADLSGQLAYELDRYACEAIVEASMRQMAEATAPEQLRGLAVLWRVSGCDCCPFCHQSIDDEPLCRYPMSDRPQANAVDVYHAYDLGVLPFSCPLSDGGVLVRPKPLERFDVEPDASKTKWSTWGRPFDAAGACESIERRKAEILAEVTGTVRGRPTETFEIEFVCPGCKTRCAVKGEGPQ